MKICPLWVAPPDEPQFDGATSVMCAKPVLAYRQCGAGCKLEIGYCVDHGGDARAVEEMKLHHATHEVP